MDNAGVVMLAEDQRTNSLAADSAELMRWKGRHLLPSTGCKLTSLMFGQSSVIAEYEASDECLVQRILVNGRMVSAEDVVHPKVLERWESELRAAKNADCALPVAFKEAA